jgi:hypothetical protein
MDWRSGNRRRRRSDCVPLPTPGAPMRMTRAALLSFMVEGVVEGFWRLCCAGLEARRLEKVYMPPLQYGRTPSRCVPTVQTSKTRRDNALEYGGAPTDNARRIRWRSSPPCSSLHRGRQQADGRPNEARLRREPALRPRECRTDGMFALHAPVRLAATAIRSGANRKRARTRFVKDVGDEGSYGGYRAGGLQERLRCWEGEQTPPTGL